MGALAGRWAEHKATHAAVNELITVDYLLTMLNFKLLFRVPWKTEAIILTAKLILQAVRTETAYGALGCPL